jgi:hypothetical protein
MRPQKRIRKRVRDERNLPVDTTPMRELILARNDPGGTWTCIRWRQYFSHVRLMSSIPSRDTTAQAALYLRAFNRLVAEGRVVRERALALM